MSPTGLLYPRQEYRPFLYDRAREFWEKQQNSHWLHTEVPMSSDIQDWKLHLSDAEREVVGGVLKGFIQTELVVNDYWTKMVSGWFQHPEIAMMCSTFGAFECFDDQSELLTAAGWKSVTEITDEDVIAQYELGTGAITFTRPKKVVSYPYDGLMHHYSSSSTDICVTPNHDLIVMHPGSLKVQKRKSYEGKWGRNYLYPCTGSGQGSSADLTAMERVLIAVQADGCLRGNCPSVSDEYRLCDVHLTKSRKIERLRALLTDAEIPFSETPLARGDVRITFHIPGDVCIQDIKSFAYVRIEDFSQAKAKAFIDEALRWDGARDRKFWYNTNLGALDVMQAVAALAGVACVRGMNRKATDTLDLVLPNGRKPKSAKDCYVLSFSDTEWRTYPHRKEVQYTGNVYCVSVPTQNLVSRRNGKVAMTGNTVHTFAYAYLNDSLGLTDYDAFLAEPSAKAKIDRIVAVRRGNASLDREDDNVRSDLEWRQEVARSLAVFSAFTEGVSIFSAFAILLNFSRFNKLKGVGQIISWSIRDESLHSQAGCWLFREFVRETPEVWTDEVKKDIYEAARTTVQLEDAFIDKVFSHGAIEGIDPHDVKAFIRHRANVKLGELGLKANWKNIDKDALQRMDWFDYLSSGVEHQDFFAQRVVDYSKGAVVFSDETMWG